MKIGIYCTVCRHELNLALATLHFAESSEYISDIAILITDDKNCAATRLTDKITIYSENFGSGYSRSIQDGGYDQIAARNYLLEKMEETEADWILMHDADDIYGIDFYQYIVAVGIDSDAVTCSCYTVTTDLDLCAPANKVQLTGPALLVDPHTRAWKKSLGLRYVKSDGVEKFFSNHSRHCGVIFPEDITLSCTGGLYHFHLHALLNKRHSQKISGFPVLDYTLPENIRQFLENNNELFI